MNKYFKLSFMAVITVLGAASLCYAAPLVKVEGRQLLADFDQDGSYDRFFIKGVGYSPTPIGRSGIQWGETNIFDDEALLRRDFQLLYDMNANTIRMWKADNTNNASNEFPNFLTNQTLTVADEYGLKVIPGFWIGFSGWWECQEGNRVFSWDENVFDLQMKTVRSAVRADILNRWQNFLQQFKGRSEILFWAIGNENNLQLGDDEQLVRAFYSLVNEMAQMAHAIDPDHPVAFVNGEISVMVSDGNGGEKNIFGDDLAPDIDIWGVNVYRGETFGDFFDEYTVLSQKPLWISEYGIDAWHSIIEDEDGGYEDQETQAQWVGNQWDEIVFHADVTIGATVMEYADEWWKPYQWLCQKPGWWQWWRPYWELYPDGSSYPCGVFNDTHDLYGIGPMDTTCDANADWFPAAPDQFFNEEWWGIMSVQKSVTEGDPDIVTPRAVYGVLQNKFFKGLVRAAAMSLIAPNTGFSGDVVTIQGEDFGDYKADVGFDPACDLNQDGVVNNLDTQIFVAAYGRNMGQTGFNVVADINRDGRVDFNDFVVLLNSYGKSAGQTYVTFFPSSTASARIISWSDTEIQCEVPIGAQTGLVVVHAPMGSSDGIAFTVLSALPVITQVSPREGTIGDTVTITGEKFGAFDGTLHYNPAADFNSDGIVNMVDYSVLSSQWGQIASGLSADLNHDGKVDSADLTIFYASWLGQRGSRYFEFSGGKVARVLSWSDTEVVIEVPYGAETGPITLVTETQRIDAGEFVFNALAIHYLSSSSGSAGSLLQIHGSGFGQYVTVGNYDPAMDFDHDSNVDYDDFLTWFSSYGSIMGGPSYNPYADFDHNGIIDFSDFVRFVDAYGSSRGPSHVLFGGNVEAKIVSWTSSAITCEVPFFASSGDVRVSVDGVESNGKMFTIL